MAGPLSEVGCRTVLVRTSQLCSTDSICDDNALCAKLSQRAANFRAEEKDRLSPWMEFRAAPLPLLTLHSHSGGKVPVPVPDSGFTRRDSGCLVSLINLASCGMGYIDLPEYL